jgi:hypothetical protein
MQRRGFLSLVTAGAAGFALSARADLVAATERIDCRVAGVSYQDIDVRTLRQGATATVSRDRHDGKACYRVLDENGMTIGFVPRDIVSVLEQRRIKSAWLSKVNPHAVPWRQVELTILFH